MKTNTLRTVIAATILGTATSAIAATDYLETFPNISAGGIPFDDVGWNVYLSADDGSVNDLSLDGSGYGGLAEVYNLIGGYGYTRPAGNAAYLTEGGPGLIFTTETTAALDSTSLADITSISVDLSIDGSVADPASARFAIQIDSQWYASDLQNVSTTEDGTAGFAAFALSGVFDFTDGNNWRTMTVTTGAVGEITVANTVIGGTLSGDVTAFGMYADHGKNGDHWRLDNYAVSAIPEPSTYALLSGALALAGVMIRRRRV